MDNKAEITIQGFLFSFLTAFLVISIFGYWIASSVNIYDITGYNETQLETFSNSDNLTQLIEEQGNNIKETTVDKNIFDYFAGIFDTVLAPLQTIIGTISTAVIMGKVVVVTLQLPPMFTGYFIAIITVFMIIGILLIKMFLGRNK